MVHFLKQDFKSGLFPSELIAREAPKQSAGHSPKEPVLRQGGCLGLPFLMAFGDKNQGTYKIKQTHKKPG